MRIYKIAGNIVIIKKNSLSINDRLNERTNASFIVLKPDFEITKGMDVVIMENETVIFAGKVYKQKSRGDEIREISISCTDYSIMIDKRIIAEAYESTLAGNIVRDFITKYFAVEGITAGNIEDGPLISRAVFNYDNGNKAMNYIHDVTGLYWEIDKDKRLNFFNKATYKAPFSLTDTSFNYKDLKSEEDISEYRNRQYTRGGMEISSIQTRTFKGDGETQSFNLDLPVAKVPTVRVNGQVKTVGIRNLEKDKEWYWKKDDNVISQASDGIKLTSSDVLSVDYQGFYPIIVVAENPGEIEKRKHIEGGSGIYESVVEESNLDTKDSALEYTQGLLEKYGFIPKVVSFTTHIHGLKAGQLISIQNSKQHVNSTFLVESLTARVSNGSTLYSVKCLDGSKLGGWEKFFKSLVQNQKKLVIRENEILVKLIAFRDQFKMPRVEDEITYKLHQYKLCGQIICGTGVII